MWRVGHNGGISEMNRQKCCGGKKVPAMSRGYAAQRPASHCRCSGNSVGKEVHKSAALVKRFFLDRWNIEMFGPNVELEEVL